jgi:hypothetical protein
MRTVYRVINIVTLLLFWVLLYIVGGQKAADKKFLSIIWWNEKTAKRVANFNAETENLCALRPGYREQHQKRVDFATELGMFLRLYKKLNQ